MCFKIVSFPIKLLKEAVWAWVMACLMPWSRHDEVGLQRISRISAGRGTCTCMERLLIKASPAIKSHRLRLAQIKRCKNFGETTLWIVAVDKGGIDKGDIACSKNHCGIAKRLEASEGRVSNDHVLSAKSHGAAWQLDVLDVWHACRYICS